MTASEAQARKDAPASWTGRGWAVIREVNETSDGFLIGWADFYDEPGGELLESHSVFLGQARRE